LVGICNFVYYRATLCCRAVYAVVHLLVCECVSGCSVHCGKTADRIRMPFGMVGRMGPRMRQIVGFGDRSTKKGNFGGECWAPRCNQWGACGVAVQKCVNSRSCSSGCSVRGVGLGVLDGGPRHARGR